MKFKLKAAVIGALDIEHMGGGEGNAVMISNLLVEYGFHVKYFGSGCPVDNSQNQERVETKFEYEPSAFSHDMMTNPFILRTSRLLTLGLTGFLKFRKTYNKVCDYDLYYFQNPTYLMRKLLPRLIKQGSKVILANHGTYYEFLGNSNSRLLRTLGRLATKFILDPIKPYSNQIVIHTQNSFQTEFYTKNGFPEKSILEIPQHNVDVQLYHIDQAKEGFEVAFLGRLTESKGLDILPDIIRLNPDIKFHIIGNGPMKDLLSASLPESNAILHGFVSEEEKRHILSKCDAIVIPSYFESLSIAAIEALVSGLPLIGSDTAFGLRHILKRNPLFGQLVPRNANKFSESLKFFMKKKEDNPSEFLAERKLRRKEAIELFDNMALSRQMLKMVERTVSLPKSVKSSDLEIPVTG